MLHVCVCVDLCVCVCVCVCVNKVQRVCPRNTQALSPSLSPNPPLPFPSHLQRRALGLGARLFRSEEGLAKGVINALHLLVSHSWFRV